MAATQLRPVSDGSFSVGPCAPIAFAPAMAAALCRAQAFAPAATPVVLYGESGTGKTFLAEHIHHLSGRAGGFHALSVGTLSPELAEDKLFGHMKGGFTGAQGARAGAIATAGTGTLLLDDLHTLALGTQAKLLQVLDRGTYNPVGSDRMCVAACRFLFAAAADPDVLVEEGRLLVDLRYRLRGCRVYVPSLRERRGDIPLLAQRALERCRARTNLDGPTRIAPEALTRLEQGTFKGNIRDLEGVVESAYLLARHAESSVIGPEHLNEDLLPPLRYVRRGDRASNLRLVEQALERTSWNVGEAAKLLGVSRRTLSALLATRPSRGGQGAP